MANTKGQLLTIQLVAFRCTGGRILQPLRVLREYCLKCPFVTIDNIFDVCDDCRTTTKCPGGCGKRVCPGASFAYHNVGDTLSCAECAGLETCVYGHPTVDPYECQACEKYKH